MSNETLKYNWVHGILKLVVKGGVLLIPLAMNFIPETWLQLTVGGVLYLLVDYLQKLYTSL